MNRLVLICLFAICGATQAATKEWFYTDVSQPKAPQIVLAPTYFGGHLHVAATVCADESNFICYESKGFQFAFPRSGEIPKTWNFKGIRYQLTGQATFMLLGTSVDAVWIEQKSKASAMRFLFSKKQGLLGFQSLNPKGRLYLLESSCGLGASADCKKD